MKKVFLSLMAVAAALFVSSCAKEVAPEVGGNEAAITIGLNLENGAATKALGDGTTVNKLVYAIFNEQGQIIYTTVDSDENGLVAKDFKFPNTETINLAKGQAYTIVFWAQNKTTDAYTVKTTSTSMDVEVNYEGLNNDEKRDAFYKKVEVPTVTSSTSIDVVLERPFAQLNVGVYQSDWENALASGIEVLHSSVKLGGVATKIDLFSETVYAESATTIKYDFDRIPTEELQNVTVNDVKNNYIWLSMSYVLPLDRTNSNLLEDLEFTFDPKAGNDYVLNEGLNNVPVQANYRTNIVGQILTGTIDFNISIDPIFENEDHNTHLPVLPVEETEEGVYEITNENELLWIAEQINGGDKLAGKTVKLMNDIVMTGVEWTPLNLWGPDGTALAELDGNGYKIIGLEVKGADKLGFIGSYASSSVLTIKNLTFVDPVVESSSSFVGTVVGYTYGNVTLDNVKVTGAEISTSANKGIRLGGLVGLYPDDAKQPLVLNNCVVENSTIKGYHNLAGLVGSTMGSAATFTNCQSNNNTFYPGAANAAAWQNFDANGYAEGKAVKEGCTTEGNKKASEVAGNDEVEDAIENGASQLVLAEGTYTVPATAKGETLTFVGTGKPEDTVIECNGNAGNGNLAGSTVKFENLTIESNGATYNGFTHVSGATYKNCIINNQFTLYNDGKEPLVFEDCTFNVTGDLYNLWTWGASAVFTNCTFNCDGKAALVYGGTPESTVTFNSCTFNDNGDIDGKAAIETGDDYSVKYNININKCTVNGFDVTTPKQELGGDDLGTNVWGNKDRMTRDNLNVFIDGTEVY